jgi:hypothetical protein
MRSISTILLVLVTGLLAACGGDSADKDAPGSESHPLVGLPNPSATRTPPVEAPPGEGSVPASASKNGRSGAADSSSPDHAKRSSKTQKGTRSTTKGHADGARGQHKQKALAPSAKRPCSLVTKTQASAIIGSPIVEPLEAPQGPTCIYRARAGKTYITLTVQTVDFAAIKKQIRNARKVSVSGSSAYCGTYGRQMLYLPLSGDRVLSVSAPCGTATRFAAKAASHL